MRILPDVTSDRHAEIPLTLKWVGIEGIAVPISVNLQGNELQTIAAKADVFVSLETQSAKGIHMSRLHVIINQLAGTECQKDNIEGLLEEMIRSQRGIGYSAILNLSFNLLLKKPALLSNESGYQSYPVTISAETNALGSLYEFAVKIPYSSTCPCSASLAQQLYANAVHQAFPGSTIDKTTLMEWMQSQAGSVATPHSQRSYAHIRLSVGNHTWPDLPSLIFQLEEIIGTPVQTAVKRADEQEFARLNATNLMFCEDAARRIKHFLGRMENVRDYWFKVEHKESLHAHNAVVVDQKFAT